MFVNMQVFVRVQEVMNECEEKKERKNIWVKDREREREREYMDKRQRERREKNF